MPSGLVWTLTCMVLIIPNHSFQNLFNPHQYCSLINTLINIFKAHKKVHYLENEWNYTSVLKKHLQILGIIRSVTNADMRLFI